MKISELIESLNDLDFNGDVVFAIATVEYAATLLRMAGKRSEGEHFNSIATSFIAFAIGWRRKRGLPVKSEECAKLVEVVLSVSPDKFASWFVVEWSALEPDASYAEAIGA
jgi:hypothetical protein